LADTSPQCRRKRRTAAPLGGTMREAAARCDQDRGRAKSEAAAHGMLAANASAIGNAIANRNLVSINSHRCKRGGSVYAKPASSATALMTG